MDKARLTPARLVKELARKIRATYVKVFYYKGSAIYSKRLADHRTQLEALKLATELRGMMPNPRLQVAGSGDFTFIMVGPKPEDPDEDRI